uniref:TACC_C domain-containing protein n=1 Tax=Strongyloides stercoralis TaxID=6248 RepID=A0A0K0E9B3_STRER
MASLNELNKTGDTDDELNKTEDSLDGNLTEDEGPVTQSDEGELNRTADSLDANLTEDDMLLPPSSNIPDVLLKKRSTDLSKTVSLEDLTQDTVSADDSQNFFHSGTMSETKQDNLSAINKTVSTINDGSVTITRPRNKSKLDSAMLMMSSGTHSTYDNSTKLLGLTKSTLNGIDDSSSTNEDDKVIGQLNDKYLPSITEELVAKISTIISNGNNDDTIKKLIELTKEISQRNYDKIAQGVDIEFNILETTLENYYKAFLQLKNQFIQKKSTNSSAEDQTKAHFNALLESVEYIKSQLNSGIISYNEQARILENSAAITINQNKDLWEQFYEIKEIEDQFVKYLDAYRKIRTHYKRLILSTESQKEKAREDQERNLTILKLNIRKIQKDVEEHQNILKNKQDHLKELDSILESYMEKIDGDSSV